jgi:16S rRNA (uracil1498-N3)-methyltransferase
LAEGAEVKLDPQQTNYLVNVLRLGAGAPVLLFNGRDGEFSASLATSSRKASSPSAP